MTLECAQKWSMWINDRDGAFIYGDMDRQLPPIALLFTVAGQDISFGRDRVFPQRVWLDERKYQVFETTAIDANLKISYRIWRLPVWSNSTVRLKAETRRDGFKWRIVPTSEAPIPDGQNGLIVETKGTALTLFATGHFRP